MMGDATLLEPDEDQALGRVKVTYMEEGFHKVRDKKIVKSYDNFLLFKIYLGLNDGVCV